MSAKTSGTLEAEDAKAAGRRKFSWIRTVAIALLGVVACLALGAYVVVHWAERQVLTTDNWVALVSPLPQNPTVSSALGGYIASQVFSTVPVKDEIANALPPRAAFLADPLTGQLQSLTTRIAQNVVASDGFQTVWEGANRIAMNRLVSTARGQTPPLQSKLSDRFNINLSGSLPKLQSALGSAASALPALQPSAGQAIAVSTNLHAKTQRIGQIIRLIDYLSAVLPWLIAASVLWALAWSRYRRHTMLILAASFIILLLIELIGIKYVRQSVLNQVHNPSNLSAVGYIYDVLVGWLKHMIYIAIAAMVILIGLLLLGGPALWAQRARAYVRLDRLKTSRVLRVWADIRTWCARWEYFLWLAAGVLVLAIVAGFNTVTARVLTNAALVALCLFAALHIVSTKPKQA